MLIRIRIDLPFDITKKAQAEKLKEALLPFIQYAKNINEGQDNQEIGYIDVEKCGHDEGVKCEKLARWEVGKGKVF